MANEWVPLKVRAEDAVRIWDWLLNRGGLAVWQSINLSNPGASWTTPVNDAQGTPVGKPSWQAGDQPAAIITSPSDVLVETVREVKRFRVGVRVGGQGLSLKVTDGGTRRIRKELERAREKYGVPASYEFDYSTQEAVIFISDQEMPIAEYMVARGWRPPAPGPGVDIPVSAIDGGR